MAENDDGSPETSKDDKVDPPEKKKRRQQIMVGAAIVGVVLTILLIRRSSASSTSASATPTTASNPYIDPTTGIPYASEYGGSGAGMYGGSSSGYSDPTASYADPNPGIAALTAQDQASAAATANAINSLPSAIAASLPAQSTTSSGAPTINVTLANPGAGANTGSVVSAATASSKPANSPAIKAAVASQSYTHAQLVAMEHQQQVARQAAAKK